MSHDPSPNLSGGESEGVRVGLQPMSYAILGALSHPPLYVAIGSPSAMWAGESARLDGAAPRAGLHLRRTPSLRLLGRLTFP